MTRFDDLLTWRESSTTGEAIRVALDGGGSATEADAADAANRILGRAARIVVSGAGSSYSLALVVAAVARDVLRRPVIAVPLSELILRPEGVLTERPGGRPGGRARGPGR